MAKNNQSYKYRKVDSILYNQNDEYSLSIEEYYKLYNFFVTYSCCGTQSMKKRSLVDYGWNYFSRNIGNFTPNPQLYLKDALTQIIDLDDQNQFIFTMPGDDISQCFSRVSLSDGAVSDLEIERCVCTRNNERNRFLNLFYRVRDGFAHGKFVLKYGANNCKIVVIQDDDGHSVTARIVLKLDTLLRIVDVVDRNNIIQ